MSEVSFLTKNNDKLFKRLEDHTRAKYGVDGFKFDAGEG